MSAVADAILAEAATWVGTPYRHQGTTRGVGCDCLGFVRGIWRAVYGGEPASPGAYAPDWAEAGGEDRLLSAARTFCRERDGGGPEPGDLLVFRWRDHMNAKHCGLYAGTGRFYHAYDRHAVLLSPLTPSWRRRIAGIFAFPDRNPDTE